MNDIWNFGNWACLEANIMKLQIFLEGCKYEVIVLASIWSLYMSIVTPETVIWVKKELGFLVGRVSLEAKKSQQNFVYGLVSFKFYGPEAILMLTTSHYIQHKHNTNILTTTYVVNEQIWRLMVIQHQQIISYQHMI